MNCGKCGMQFPDGNAFCPACGAPAKSARRCPKCQREVGPGVRFCPGCGTTLTGEAAAAERKTKIAASPQRSKLTWGNFLKRILENWKKGLLRSIPLMIFIFIISIAVHTFLIVYYNEGFGDSTWLGRQLLNIKNNAVSSTILWMLISGFIFTAIPAMIKKGVGGFFSELAAMPGKTIKFLNESSNTGIQLFLTGIGLTLILSSIMSGMTNLVLAVGVAAIFAMPLGRLLAVLIQSAWMALLQSLRPGQARNLAQFGLIPGYLLIAGTTAGFVMGTVLPFTLFFGLAALAVAILLVFSGKEPPTTVMRTLFFLSLIGYVVLYVKGAVADDGGWQEAGGTWSGWASSQGATEAVTRGVGPALGAAVGPSLLGAASGVGPEDFSDSPDDESAEPGGDDVVVNDPILYGGPDDNPNTEFHGGNGPGECSINGLPNYWVNTATLNLVIRDTVFASSGLGPTVRFTQTCNSNPGAVGMFGRGWRFSYESTVEQSGEIIQVCRGSGQRIRFQTAPYGQPNQPVEASPLDGRNDRLLDYGGYWLFIEKGSKLMYKYDKPAGGNPSRLTAVIDLNGNQVRVSYNPDGTIESITDAANRVTRFVSSGGLCTSMTVPDGRTASYAYDQQGNLVQAVDLLGVTTDYEYDAEGFLTRMTVGRERRSTSFTYRKIGRGRQVAAVTDAAGSTTYYEMVSGKPCQVRVTDREGKITTYYSSTGVTERVVDPMGNYYSYTYAGGRPVSFTDKNGKTASMEYDARGNLIRAVDALGGVTTRAYDSYENLQQLTNPLGETWSFVYDERQNLVSVTSPTGRVQLMEYDSRGLLKAITNSAGIKSGFDYDRFGNLARVDYPLGNTTHLAYDEYGFFNTSRTDAAGNTTRYEYDQNGRLTKVVHPDGATRSYGYDCCAGIFTTDENGRTVAYERDPLLNITRYHDGMGNATSYRYDRNRRLLNAVDATGRSISYEYDGAGRMVRLIDAMGQFAEFHYDAAGNLTALQDQCGQRISFEYDAGGRMTRFTDLLGNTFSVIRDALGRTSSIVNSRGSRVGFAYDANGQITSKLYEGAVVTTCGYDAAGNLAQVADAGGVTTHLYDAARRVEKVEYPDGLKASFAYSLTGSLTSVTYPGDLTVMYEYDPRGRLARMSWGEHAVTFKYDAVGNLIHEARSNGTESAYDRDANYQLTGVRHVKGGNAFVDLHYARDLLGNITAEKGTKPLDGLGAGEAVKAVRAVYNRVNQLVNWNDDTFSYDADGNLTAINGGRAFNAAYDPENRLVQMTSGGRTVSYAYNGLNQRVRAESGGQVKNYHYSSDGLLLFITDGSGRLTSQFLYSGNRLVAMVGPDGTSCFYHFNHNGSTLALTDENGEIAAAYDYSPFGAVVKRTGTIPGNPFTYVGAWGVMDEGDGWFFMKHRYYDTQTGRFIQKDPIGITGGHNLYQYVGNNPVNRIDPEGTVDPVTITAGLILIGFTAAAYTAAKAASSFGAKNPLTRTLEAASTGDSQKIKEAHGPNPQGEYFNDPEHGLNQVITTTGDKILSTNPISGPGWSAIQAVNKASQGKPGEAVLEASGLLPGAAGEVGDAANEIYDACKAPGQ